MKLLAVCFLLLLERALCDEPTYSTKYDNVDLDEILTSERLLNGYVKCLLDQGPCTPDGKELKQNIPDAIGNDCKKCSKKQREGSQRVYEYIIDHRPEDWAKLEERYNPSGTYKKRYLERKEKAAEKNEKKAVTPKPEERDYADETSEDVTEQDKKTNQIN